ncbi:hypothetical protein M2161_006003 [Streptomyces sp. SAI-133]|uniref:hypothetical protein n=1 Tax=unclassified Streptomyces TaxID=2593676 RepID=UPI0024760546|nr:hypothetical protein [Streptomyces sp. SAI-133]MDH6586897.1 hypothetical protein [Streptomyces sp. SAI-133]
MPITYPATSSGMDRISSQAARAGTTRQGDAEQDRADDVGGDEAEKRAVHHGPAGTAPRPHKPRTFGRTHAWEWHSSSALTYRPARPRPMHARTSHRSHPQPGLPRSTPRSPR